MRLFGTFPRIIGKAEILVVVRLQLCLLSRGRRMRMELADLPRKKGRERLERRAKVNVRCGIVGAQKRRVE